MSNIIYVEPLLGITWNEKNINFSNTKEDVERILGKPYRINKHSYAYFHNELKFHFNEVGNIEFIEFLAGIEGILQPYIYGVEAFKVDADTLYELLKDKNNGDIDDSEHGYSYGFLNISVGVFRDRTLESVQEMIQDAIEEDDVMDEEDIAYEMKKANHWASIGIGIKDYYV